MPKKYTYNLDKKGKDREIFEDVNAFFSNTVKVPIKVGNIYVASLEDAWQSIKYFTPSVSDAQDYPMKEKKSGHKITSQGRDVKIEDAIFSDSDLSPLQGMRGYKDQEFDSFSQELMIRLMMMKLSQYPDIYTKLLQDYENEGGVEFFENCPKGGKEQKDIIGKDVSSFEARDKKWGCVYNGKFIKEGKNLQGKCMQEAFRRLMAINFKPSSDMAISDFDDARLQSSPVDVLDKACRNFSKFTETEFKGNSKSSANQKKQESLRKDPKLLGTFIDVDAMFRQEKASAITKKHQKVGAVVASREKESVAPAPVVSRHSSVSLGGVTDASFPPPKFSVKDDDLKRKLSGFIEGKIDPEDRDVQEFKKIVASQASESIPTKPYVGIGAKVDIQRDGDNKITSLKISNIYAPDFKRFKDESGKDIEPKSLIGKSITGFYQDGELKKFSDLSEKQVAELFHKVGQLDLEIDGKKISCQREENKVFVSEFCKGSGIEKGQGDLYKPQVHGVSILQAQEISHVDRVEAAKGLSKVTSRM